VPDHHARRGRGGAVGPRVFLTGTTG
jgi:hypothetical protein